MKKLLLIVSVFISVLCSAQITLDKKFEGAGHQTRLTKDGLKSYIYSSKTHKLTIYNPDLSVYKNIDVPDVGDNYAFVDYVSDSLFATDVKIEYIIEFNVGDDGYFMILNEDGDTLLSSKGNIVNNPVFDLIQGNPTRLSVSFEYGIEEHDSTYIYTLPGKFEPINQACGECDNGGSTTTQVISLDASGLANATPNPASKIVTVQYALPNSESQANINLINANGVTVDEQKIYENTGVSTFNLSTLADGIYFIQLETKNGFQSQKKLIVVE